MGYVAARAFACIAQDDDDPSPIRSRHGAVSLTTNLKAAYDALGPHTSLDGLTVGVRFTASGAERSTAPSCAVCRLRGAGRRGGGLRLRGPDEAGRREEARAPVRHLFWYHLLRQTPTRTRASRCFGAGRTSMEDRVVGGHSATTPRAGRWVAVKVQLVKAEPGSRRGARVPGDLADRKDYDAAFRYLSPAATAVTTWRAIRRSRANSPEDAGRKVRAGLEAAGSRRAPARSLDAF